jgi:zinc protease
MEHLSRERIVRPRLLTACLIAVAAQPLIAQGAVTQAGSVSLRDPIPLDPSVKMGVLPNGLRYYIQRHPQPAKRAELRLAVNAGGINEDDDQVGMAHLIEHMGFNGTTHFKKNDLIDYLRSVGVRFGADLNAYTSTDETVYMLQIPSDTARILEQGIVVLSDWASGSQFDSTEVANERGVVVEEWRGGQGAFGRMRRKMAPIMYKGSKYATRDVIGTDRSILSATPALLKRFYNDWYRPDLQAVVVVGDIDVANVEALIKKHFSAIPRPNNPRPRVVVDLPDNREPLVAIASDKEAFGTTVQLITKLPRTTVTTVSDYREQMLSNLFSSMLRSRFTEIAQKPDAPFVSAFGFKGSFTRGKDAFTLAAQVKEGGAERAVEALLTEVRRVEQFGFLPSELERAKASSLRSYEQQYADREKAPSGFLVNAYVYHFLEQQPVPGPEYTFRLAQQLFPTVTLQEVNALARRWLTAENRIITVQAPEKAGVKVPTESDILAALDRASKATTVAYTETVSNEPLIARLLPPGKVLGEKTRPEVGITEWTLSNGARVIVKPTDFRADQVLFGAYSLGGRSLLPDADVITAQMAGQIAMSSGAGNLSRTDLTKRLAGKAASVFPSIGETSETVQGQASPKDIETLFQLVYLQFTAPRLDSAAFQAFMNQQRAFLANRGASPEGTFFDTVSVTMASHSPRVRPVTLETLNEVTPDRAYQIFKERFADAGDFTFVFVGSVDVATLKPLVERYIASMPSTGTKESWKDVGARPPTGLVEKVVRKGTEPKALSQVFFTGPIDYTEANQFAMRALIEVMRYKLIQTLREGMSGTYSPGIGGGATKIPRPQYQISINFGSSPENAERLYKAAMAIIDTLKAQGPTQAEVDNVKEQLVRTREVDLKQNAFWISNIMSRGQTGEDVAALLAPYDAMIARLTPAQVQQAARVFFNTSNVARFVLLPEGTKPVP